MEKLKSLRKQRGYTQEYMSKIPRCRTNPFVAFY